MPNFLWIRKTAATKPIMTLTLMRATISRSENLNQFPSIAKVCFACAWVWCYLGCRGCRKRDLRNQGKRREPLWRMCLKGQVPGVHIYLLKVVARTSLIPVSDVPQNRNRSGSAANGYPRLRGIRFNPCQRIMEKKSLIVHFMQRVNSYYTRSNDFTRSKDIPVVIF